MAAAAEPKHDQPEYQHHQAPPKIDVEVERALVERRVADQADAGEQQPENQEQQSERQTDVESHGFSYIKMMFSSTTIARAITARIAGL